MRSAPARCGLRRFHRCPPAYTLFRSRTTSLCLCAWTYRHFENCPRVLWPSLSLSTSPSLQSLQSKARAQPLDGWLAGVHALSRGRVEKE